MSKVVNLNLERVRKMCEGIVSIAGALDPRLGAKLAKNLKSNYDRVKTEQQEKTEK